MSLIFLPMIAPNHIVPYVAWNSADKSDDCVLSSGNLVATSSSGIQNVRATLGRSANKHYFEVLCTTVTGTSGIFGLMTQANGPGDFSDGYTGGCGMTTGGYQQPTPGSQIVSGWTNGDVGAVAWNATSGDCWFLKNGTSIYGDPVAETSPLFNVTGTLYPALSIQFGDEYRGRFRIQDFSYTPPTGFLAWQS